jgi:hypothetical protein
VRVSFDSPEFLWGLVAMLPVTALYLLARRRRNVVTPSLFLWRRAGLLGESGTLQKPRSFPWELLWALAFVAAAVLAASSPRRPGAGPAPRRFLVLFDRSASMACPAFGGGTRHSAAKASLADLLQSWGPHDEVTLRGFPPFLGGDLSFSPPDGPEVLKALSGPTDEPASPRDALALGVGPGVTVYLLSDGAFTSEQMPGPAVGLRLVGGPAPNVGFVELGIDRIETKRWQVFSRVANFTTAPTTRPVTLRDQASGRILARRIVSLPPNTTVPVILGEEGINLAGIDVIEVRLEGTDALAADDRVVAVRQTAGGLAVHIFGPDATYLSRALRAAGHRVTSGQETHDSDLHVFHRTLPENAPSSPAIVVDPADATLGFSVSPWREVGAQERFEAPSWAPAHYRSACDQIRVSQCRILSPEENASFEPLLTLGGETVAARVVTSPGAVPIIVVGLPVTGPSAAWVWEPVFPLFWSAVVDLLNVHPSSPEKGTRFDHYHTGDVLPLPAPRDSHQGVRIEPPGAQAFFRTGRDPRLRLDRAGLYAVSRPGAPTMLLAANLLSSAESSIHGIRSSLDPPAVVQQDPTTKGTPLSSLFGFAALLLLGALSAYWFRRERQYLG